MEPANFSVTLLEGELRALECTVGEGRLLIRKQTDLFVTFF